MIRRDEEGVASTVATLFTLIVALNFLAAALAIEDAHQAERERLLVQEAQSAFGRLRTVHDLQFSAGLTPPSPLGSPLVVGVAVVLPVGLSAASPFMGPVGGRLACDPSPSVASVAFSYRASRAGALNATEASGGDLSLELQTQRIPGVSFHWENGATILAQGSNAVIVDYPYFRVEPLADGVRVVYRLLRMSDDQWGMEGTGPQFLALRTIAAESYTLDVTGGGEADLDDVQQFVFDLAREIYDASTDGSGRIVGSYADSGGDVPDPPNNPNPGIVNQGLKEQLVYYNSALTKQQSGDCGGAANEMNASARQLLQNTMDKILLGIDEGFIESAWGLDLHARMGALHRCLDEMTGSLQDNCAFSCLSLFGGGGGRLEFLIASDYRAAWNLWYNSYLRSAPLDPDRWEVFDRVTFFLVQIDDVKQVTLEVANVAFV